jgi:hypothetical protein
LSDGETEKLHSLYSDIKGTLINVPHGALVLVVTVEDKYKIKPLLSAACWLTYRKILNQNHFTS